MTELNWNAFKTKFNGKEAKAFESLAYQLFCKEFHKPTGLHRFKNQAGIETNSVRIGIEHIGFQAKFYETKLSANKDELISAIQTAKRKNIELTKILFYLNQEFPESPKPDKKDPLYKIEIESVAKKEGVTIEWRVPSHIEIQLFSPENEYLAQRYFGINNLLSANQILQKFESASFHLDNVISHFEGLKDSHINRKETDQLIQWVNTPLKKEEKGIILLVGNAGFGKSVILKDTYNHLKSSGIPVLGIKADKYYAQNKQDLTAKLDFEIPLEKAIGILNENHNQVVVLIDQIDALSQSLSSKRDYIDSFQMLISSLSRIEGVRIIISVRTYDLNYDSDLRYYQNQKTINVSSLDQGQTDSILSQRGIERGHISNKLFELIAVPHHLNVLCKIYKDSSNLLTIQTLHDLYNELWTQKIIKPGRSTSFKAAIYEIAEKMHSEQKISISRFKIGDDFSEELEYLKSNNLLTVTDNEIQFFHQTFFDYCFAKQFVEADKSIENYVLSNHQGLFIRSSLKMVMSFQRESDHDQYIKVFKNVVTSRKYKFHLKVLLINELGFRENPSDSEKDLVRKILLKKKDLGDVFFEAVNTGSWLEFLSITRKLETLTLKPVTINHAIFNLFYSQKIRTILKLDDPNGRHLERLNQVNLMFRRLLPRYRHQALPILKDLPEFDDKPRFVFNLLYFLKEWDNPIAFALFEQYEFEAEKDTHSFHKILEDTRLYDLEWTFKIYKKHLLNKVKQSDKPHGIPKLDHYETSLFEKLFEIDLWTAFKFAFDFISHCSKKSSFSYMEEKEIELKSDSAFLFFEYEEHSRNGEYDGLYYLLIEKIKLIATETPSKYQEFYDKHKSSEYLTVLFLIVFGLKENPMAFTNQILEFFEIFLQKGGFNVQSDIHHYLRKLITNSYSLISHQERLKLNNILLNIQPKYEMRIDLDGGKKRHWLQYSGHTQYMYLDAIPTKEREKDITLKKRYSELQRKLGKVVDNAPKGVHFRPVPPPLPGNAYQNMKFEDWEKSFAIFDSENAPAKYGHMVGSLSTHSRAFESEVSKRPDEFASFVEKLINENKVNQNYTLSGLRGLKEGKYNPDKFKILFKEACQLKLDKEHTLYLVWLVDYLIETNVCDPQIIGFLCDYAINHDDPAIEKVADDSLQHGINTVRGAAASRLLYPFDFPELKDLIFDTLDKVLDDFSLSVRSSIMPRLSNLMKLDKDKTLELFLKAIRSGEIEILKHSPSLAQYLSNHFFEEMHEYFEIALDLEEIQGDVAVILSVLWVRNEQNCFGLLSKFLKKSEVARSKMVDVSIYYLFDKNLEVKDRAKRLFQMFLDSEDEKVVQEYSTAFLHLQDQDVKFEAILPFLEKYSKSKVIRKSPHYYYEYLLKHAKKYPKECIDLVSKFKYYEKPDMSKSGYYEDDPVKILIGSYNSLRTINRQDYQYMKKSMSIFDEMLKDKRFRRSANNVIDQVDS